MSEAKKSETNNVSKGQNNFWKRIGIYAAVILGVFLLGLVPMWLMARERADERDAARSSLRLSQMQNRLATAAIDARRGEYEPARMAASDFFSALRTEVDRETDRALNQGQRENLQPLLAQRDDVITLLARGDPAASERLTDLHLVYHSVIDGASR